MTNTTPNQSSTSTFRYKKTFLVIGIGVLICIFYASGLHNYLTLTQLKIHQAKLSVFVDTQPFTAVAIFLALYFVVVTLNLPGALLFGLLAGTLFGTLAGTVLISFASTISATMACGLSRYLLRNLIQKRFGQRLHRFNEGIKDEGAFYLFSLRLIPVVPFFIINVVMGLTPIRLTTFFWVSQIGMLPGTLLFVNAGSHLSRIESLGGILSPGLLASFALIGLFPLAAKRLLKQYRRRRSSSGTIDHPDSPVARQQANRLLDRNDRLTAVQTTCTECGACVRQCGFLSRYGTPKTIAELPVDRAESLAFSCSLCGLCTTVCPENVDPSRLFLALRRTAVDRGRFSSSTYRPILTYERLGGSSLLSWRKLPEQCDTVFFPGCALPGSRPVVTRRLIALLRKTIPTLGVVLDCCTKPSHDLGRSDFFTARFSRLHEQLTASGITTVLVACPNCFKVFHEYAPGITVRMVYEILAESLQEAADSDIPASIHDPCATRQEVTVHQAVRRLTRSIGVTPQEPKHRRTRTICCGEGGMVGFVDQELAQSWTRLREQETSGLPIITYCAGCCGFLNKVTPTVHVLDLLMWGYRALSGRIPISRPPVTYFNRIVLKALLKRDLRRTPLPP